MSTQEFAEFPPEVEGELPWSPEAIIPKLREVQSVENDDEIVREVEPISVERLGGTLPWDTESEQLQCGETVTSTSGDHNFRLVYGAIITFDQLQKIQFMRQNPDLVKLVSRFYTGFVNFDELQVERIADANGAEIRGEGHVDGPLYEIQLQSKEDNES